MYNHQKFSQPNQEQYFEFLKQISAFRRKINQEIDYLEQLLHQYAEKVLLRSEESEKIIKLTETYFDNINDDGCLDLISSIISKEFPYKQKLILKEKRTLDFAVSIQRLNGLSRSFKYQVKQIFGQKQTFDLSQKDQPSGELWKYDKLAKDAKGLVATKLTPKQFFADNFLCLKQAFLTGIYICNTFEGTTNFGDKVDCQKEEFEMIFRIHEGYNTNQNLYEQGMVLKFQPGVVYKNQCFQINLTESIILKPGLIYTITLQPKNKTVTLFNLQGKGKEAVDSIRFLNKESNMNYFQSYLGELKTYTNYSPLPGLIVQA